MRRAAALISIGIALSAGGACPQAAQLEGQDGDLQPRGEQVSPSSAKLDINAAGIDALVRLPGMTPQLAEQIVRNRPYRKLDDLLTRKVLGKKQFARIREFVVVSRDKP
jgi:DNA uptake protein ComE-like DNA-binding protein